MIGGNTRLGAAFAGDLHIAVFQFLNFDKTQDAVERRADVVTHAREECCLSGVGGIGFLLFFLRAVKRPDKDDDAGEQNADDEVSNHSSSNAETKTMPDTLNGKVIASKDESIDVVNKGVMSANSTATSKAIPKNKVSNNSSTNGNGNAPKTKKGALDPNRLPDSGQDNTTNTSSDVDMTKGDITKDNINKDNVQEISNNKAVNKQDK